jgi:hypothetical protein
MKPGRVPTDVHLLFFLLLGHDHLSPLRQDSHLQLGAYEQVAQNPAGGGQCAFARILLGNGVRKCGIYSILCTTREAELRFRFRYLQLLGLYSKSPKLAFNQWVAGSSPARLIP